MAGRRGFNQLYFTYIIQNSKNKKRYIGSTEDLDKRLAEHNRGKTFSTKYAKGLWSLIYSEQYNSRIEAIYREKVIKSYKGGNALKKLLDKRD